VEDEVEEEQEEDEDAGVKNRERTHRVGKKKEWGKGDDDIWGEGGMDEEEEEEEDSEEEGRGTKKAKWDDEEFQEDD
jgi:acidic leucine-rich nuclear phosphoprotein 32 family protein B